MGYYDQVFTGADNVPERWADQEFEQCVFQKLDLPNVSFAGASFINCRFEACNLAKAGFKQTKLYDVSFLTCRLPHVDFSHCDPFGFHVDFQDCQLDYAVFINRKLKKANFTECSMKEVHFVQCELTGTVFRHCNLELAKFEDNNLAQADFSTSYNLEIDPEANKLKKARFSLHNLPGLLAKYDLVIAP